MEEITFIDILEEEGVKFKDENEKYRIVEELKKAVENGEFHFIVKDGKRIGFFCYRQRKHNGRLHRFIDNLLIYKRFRNPHSLLNMRSYFKQMGDYKNTAFHFWYSRRRDKFYYAK